MTTVRKMNPPAARPKVLTAEETKALAEKRLSDPNYVAGEVSQAPAAAPALPPVEAVVRTSETPSPPPALPLVEAVEEAPEEVVPEWAIPVTVGNKAFNVFMDPELYAKMLWCTRNVPQMSLAKIAKAGAMAEADRLIKLYYKP